MVAGVVAMVVEAVVASYIVHSLDSSNSLIYWKTSLFATESLPSNGQEVDEPTVAQMALMAQIILENKLFLFFTKADR